MNWYFAVEGKRLGPLPEEQFRALVQQGRVTANTQVWRDGMAQWQPAGQAAPQMFAPPQAAAPAAPAPPSPPPVPSAAAAPAQASPAAAAQNPLGGISGILDDAMCGLCGRLVPANSLVEAKGYQACPECLARVQASDKRTHKDLPVGQRLKLFVRNNRAPMVLIALMSILLPLMVAIQTHESAFHAAIPLRCIASGLYLLLAIWGNMHKTSAGLCMFVALLLCWAADLLQFLPFDVANHASLMVYIAAYIVLMLSFVLKGLSLRWTLGGMGVFSIASIAVWLWLHTHIPDDYLLLVIFYIIAMTVFCGLSVGQYGAGGTILVVFATAGLYAGDLFLAQNTFIESFRGFTVATISLHYIALTLLALSVFVTRADEPEQELTT